MFSKNKLPSVNVRELQSKLIKNEKLTLLDVRTAREWEQTGIIPGSILISMQELSIKLQNGFASQLKNREPIIVICRSGNRSATVTKYFVNQLGINAFNLTGGIKAWNQIGGTFERI